MDLTKLERSGIIDTGLDWLTITTIQGENTRLMLEAVHKYIHERYPTDALPKAWSAMGYKGQNYGDLKFGRRKENEAMVVLSGQEADYFGMNINIPEDRVKRVDLQVTVALDTPDPTLAQRLYHEKQRLSRTQEIKTTHKYVSSGTGDTLYIGKRSSDVFLRLYDKSGESRIGELGSIWRYEVEYKRGLAKSAYKAVMAGETRYARIARMVWDEFERKQVQPLFDPSVGMVAMETGTKVSTPDTKLGWLERCVAPVVTQLVALGYEEQVLTSLKLRGIVKG